MADVERAIEIVTAESLKTSVNYFLGGPEKLDKEEKHILSSLLRVIEYYSLRLDYLEYYESIKDDVETALETKEPSDDIIEVLEVKENKDGSADISFNVGNEMVATLVGEGLGFLMIKSTYSTTTSGIVEMCEAMKQKQTD